MSAHAAGVNFQACSFNHSDISPFRINQLRAVATNYRTRRSNSAIVRPSRSYSTISWVRRSIVETNCVTPHDLVRPLTAIVVGQRCVAACANSSGQLSSTRRGSCGTDVNGRQNRKRCPCLLGRYCSTGADHRHEVWKRASWGDWPAPRLDRQDAGMIERGGGSCILFEAVQPIRIDRQRR